MTLSHEPPPAPSAAPRRVLPSDASAGGLAFPRLVFARRRSGWWTPLVTGLLGLAFYLAFMLVIIVVLIVAAAVNPGVIGDFQNMAVDAAFDLTDPLLVAVMLGSIAAMLPAYLLASLIVNGRRLGLVSSVAGSLRWRWMLQCAAVAFAIALALTALSLLVPAADATAEPEPNPLWAVTLVILLLLVPVQAAAEEYVFRGYFMQAIGRWLRHPAFAILLPVPVFVLGHMYDPLGQIGVGLFAVGAGWLTWRTGGLEAAISLHVVNNLLAFVLGLLEGGDPAGSNTDVISFAWTVVLVGAYVAVVEVLFRRARLGRTLLLTPPARVPGPGQTAMASASRMV